MDVNGEFGDGGELAHDVFDGAGIDDHAADEQGVVEATGDAALEPLEGAAASTGRAVEGDAVAGAVAEDRHSRAAEIGDDQLALVGGCAALRIDDLADELAFVEVQAGLLAAVETPSADLGGPGVVEAVGTPSALKLGAGSREIRARLASVDGGVYAAGGEVEATVAGDFAQVQGIGRGTDEDGDLVFDDGV